MPSGAKKRKAAKKKKELEATNPNHSLDHDDAKSQDDKGSDGGEIYSPAHQDHHNNHHPFKERDPSESLPIASEDNKKMENYPSGGHQEHKVGFFESIVDKVEHKIEQKLKSDDEGSSRSSGSSRRFFESIVDKIEHKIEQKLKSDDEGSSRSSGSSRSNSSSDDEKPSKEVILVEDTPKEKDKLVAELSPVIEAVKPVVPVSEETISIVESAPIDNLLVSEVIKSDVCVQEPSSVVPETVASYSLKEEEDKVVIPISDDNSKASTSEFGLDLKGSEGKKLPPSDVYVAQPSSVSDRTKGSEIPDRSGNKPPVAPAEGAVQKTSVLSCCGIFDLFTGSNR